MNDVASAPGRRTTIGGDGQSPGDVPRGSTRVLVVFESGRGGTAALREAGELAAGGAELSVVTLAPQAKPFKCCGGGGPGPYNCAVRDQAQDELHEARSLLGSLAGRATFTLLAGSPTPPLAEWSSARSFDVIYLPAGRFARGGGQRARALRRVSSAEIRLVR